MLDSKKTKQLASINFEKDILDKLAELEKDTGLSRTYLVNLILKESFSKGISISISVSIEE